ncbi:hypothetical protein AB0J38_05185 [Streptomyces sp. NPDC050095]|uniref:hypothetical protein n=1 Tax=unclassified Streptomyces TaxID=2593676 RepID=UPI00341EDC15
MSVKKTVAKVGLPLLAAGAVCTVAAIGVTADQSDQNKHTSSTAAQPKAPVAKASVGDPDNPATWHLPIEAYMPTTAQTRLVSGVRDDLMDTCMKAAGYDQWTPAPDLPPIGGKTVTDWRYGIHDAALAAQNGYHPDPAEQQAYDAAMTEGAVDETGADEAQVRECAQQADGSVPTAQTADLVQQIDGDAYQAAMQEPTVVSAFSGWSTCMKEKGYAYAKPMDANDDEQFNDPYTISDAEIATATADVACRDKYDVEKTWFDAEVVLQEAAIKENQAALDAIRTGTQSTVAKASALAKQN